MPTDAAVQPPAPEPVSQGPWSQDLASTFEDEAIRGQVDGFLREKVQPYLTRVEQESAEARRLYDAFSEDPRSTYLDVTTQLFDLDTAKAIADYLDLLEADESEDETPEVQQSAIPPEVQALIDERNEAQERAAFEAEFESTKARYPQVDLDFDLFVPFVARTGDWDEAVKQYVAHTEAFKAKFAPQTEQAPTPTQAPPVLGSEGTTAPPVQEQPQSLDAAIDEFMDEQRAAGTSVAPPVPTA